MFVGGNGGECFQDARKLNFTAKCLNTFVAHCKAIPISRIRTWSGQHAIDIMQTCNELFTIPFFRINGKIAKLA